MKTQHIDWSTCFDTNNISERNKCITCYEQGFISYLDNKDFCQIDTCPENRGGQIFQSVITK